MFSFSVYSRGVGEFRSSVSLEHLPSHMLWQSTLWQRSLVKSGGADESILCVHEVDGKVVAYAFVEVRWVALRRKGAFILGGPVCLKWYDSRCFIDYLTEVCRERGLDFLQLESPDLLSLPVGMYRACIEPYTVRIDVSGDLEKALMDVDSKDRSAIRVSLKKGVACRELSSEDMSAFLSLMRETALRDAFHTHSDAYFRSLIRDLGGSVKLFGAFSSEGNLASAAMIVTHASTAWYYYGASSSDSQLRKLWAPLVLQHFIVETLCQNPDIHTYDLMGVAPPESPNHHLRGVTTFKKKIGPITGPIVRSYLLPLSLWWYVLKLAVILKKYLRKNH